MIKPSFTMCDKNLNIIPKHTQVKTYSKTSRMWLLEIKTDYKTII